MADYKPGALNTPLPGTSSTGNTTGMPKVNKPKARQANSKNIVKTNAPPSNTTKPGAGSAVGSAAYKAARAAAAKKAAAAKTAAAKKHGRKGTVPTPSAPEPDYGITGATGTSVPPTTFDPSATPEDQALGNNYDPNQTDFMDNTQIAGRIKGLTNALPGAIEAIDKAFGNLDMQRAATAPDPVTSGAGVANLFGGNTGAAAVAANQAQQAQATADNQAGISSDRTQANATREADWKARLQLLSAQQVGQGRADLAGAIGERDAAKKGYFDQGLKMRGDMVSQAIGNQGALNNQRISSGLFAAQLEGLGLTNKQKAAVLDTTRIQNAALPDQLATSIAAGKQGIINSVTQNQISAATAKAQLKQLSEKSSDTGGIDNLKKARAAGGDGALYSMILPTGAVVPNATTGGYQLNGDPNKYFKLGVNNIMSALPKSDRKRVEQFVSNKLQQALQTTGGWSFKNGKFVKVAK